MEGLLERAGRLAPFWCMGKSEFPQDEPSRKYPFFASIGEPGKATVVRSDVSAQEAMERVILMIEEAQKRRAERVESVEPSEVEV